jgi:hypothetical protein
MIQNYIKAIKTRRNFLSSTLRTIAMALTTLFASACSQFNPLPEQNDNDVTHHSPEKSSFSITHYKIRSIPPQSITEEINQSKTLTSQDHLQIAGRELFNLCQVADANEINTFYENTKPNLGLFVNNMVRPYNQIQDTHLFKYGENAILKVKSHYGRRIGCSLTINVKDYNITTEQMSTFIDRENGYRRPSTYYYVEKLYHNGFQACRDSYIQTILNPGFKLATETTALVMTVHSRNNPETVNSFTCSLNVSLKKHLDAVNASSEKTSRTPVYSLS